MVNPAPDPPGVVSCKQMSMQCMMGSVYSSRSIQSFGAKVVKSIWFRS